jgi:TonB family protein
MEGETSLNIYINKDGKVEQALITQSSGYLILDEAASKWAVENWRFIPCKKNNQEPVACWYPVKYRWRIDK